MIIDAKSGARGVLVNADTGCRVPFAKWANLETGEWEALAATPDGRRVAQPRRIVRGRNNLRWIPAAPRHRARPDFEPLAEAVERVRKGVALPDDTGEECEGRTCHRRAVWGTTDEQEIEPAVTEEGRRFERAVSVKVHYFCDRCFRLPVFSSVRGVESEVQVKVRPE